MHTVCTIEDERIPMLHSSTNTGMTYIWSPNLFPRHFLWNPATCSGSPHNVLHSPSYWGEPERATLAWLHWKMCVGVRHDQPYTEFLKWTNGNHRGHGGVAILWRKTLSDVHKLSEFASHHHIGISVCNHLKFFSTYLPTRSGCTDIYKETLDHLNVIREKYSDNGILIFAGDMNGDLGTSDGSHATTTIFYLFIYFFY